MNLGNRCVHRSAGAANYLRRDERLDFLFASRPIARRLHDQATERHTTFGAIRMIRAERRIWKIYALFRAQIAGTLDLREVRGYFKLFEREPLLDQLLNEQD